MQCANFEIFPFVTFSQKLLCATIHIGVWKGLVFAHRLKLYGCWKFRLPGVGFIRNQRVNYNFLMLKKGKHETDK